MPCAPPPSATPPREPDTPYSILNNTTNNNHQPTKTQNTQHAQIRTPITYPEHLDLARVGAVVAEPQHPPPSASAAAAAATAAASSSRSGRGGGGRSSPRAAAAAATAATGSAAAAAAAAVKEGDEEGKGEGAAEAGAGSGAEGLEYDLMAVVVRGRAGVGLVGRLIRKGANFAVRDCLRACSRACVRAGLACAFPPTNEYTHPKFFFCHACRCTRDGRGSGGTTTSTTACWRGTG
jgi:hypothetical protein